MLFDKKQNFHLGLTLVLFLLILASCGQKSTSSKSKKAKSTTESQLFSERKAFVERHLMPMKKLIEEHLKNLNDYNEYKESVESNTDHSIKSLKELKRGFLRTHADDLKLVQATVDDYKKEINSKKEKLREIKNDIEVKEKTFNKNHEQTRLYHSSFKENTLELEKQVKNKKERVEKLKQKIEEKGAEVEKLAKETLKKASQNKTLHWKVIKERFKYLQELGEHLFHGGKRPKFKESIRHRIEIKLPPPQRSLRVHTIIQPTRTNKIKDKRLRNFLTHLDRTENDFQNLRKRLSGLETFIIKANKRITAQKSTYNIKLKNLEKEKNTINQRIQDFQKVETNIKELTTSLENFIEDKSDFYDAYKTFKVSRDRINGEIEDRLDIKSNKLNASENKLIYFYSKDYLNYYHLLVNWIQRDIIEGRNSLELISKLPSSKPKIVQIKKNIIKILQLANQEAKKVSEISFKGNRTYAGFKVDLNIFKDITKSLKINIPRIDIGKIVSIRIELPNFNSSLSKITNLNLDIKTDWNILKLTSHDLNIENIQLKQLIDIDFTDIEIKEIEIDIPEIKFVSDLITKIGEFGQSFLETITSVEIAVPKTEFIHIEADVEKDLKAPEDILKNSLNQVDDAKKDLDRELTNAYQDLKNTLDKANEDIKREREKGLKKVGAALEAAGQPKNLARIALVYTASVYGGPMGSALANSLLDKMENPGMSDKDLFNSFVVGAAAGYAAQGVTSANVNIVKSMPNATSAIARNLTTDLGNVILKGENYSTEQFLSSLATGAVNSNVGDDFLSEIVDSGINNAATYTINTTIYKQDFDEEAFEKALYEGMANGLARETVHDLMDKYVLPPAEERGKRFDESIFDALSDLIFAQALSVQEYIAQKQLEKYNKLSTDEKKEVMEELAQIKEEFYSEYLPSVIKEQNLEYLDLESEQVQELYNLYLSHSIDQKILEGSVLSKLELTKAEEKEIGRSPAFVGTIFKAGFFALSFYGSYLTTEEVFRLKSSFEEYKKENKTKSMLDFYNEHPEEFKDLTTDVAISLVFPAFKGVKGLAKLGTKGAFKVIDSARKLFGNTTNSESLKRFANVLKKYNVEPPKWDDDIAFNPNLEKHMSKVDGFTQKAGVKGGHNIANFDEVASSKKLKIIEKVEHPSIKGIYEVKYKIPAYDRAGNVTGYKNTPLKKTVYDPKIISDTEISHLGQIAANKGYKDAVQSGARQYNGSAGGIQFRIYQENGVITNIHPKF